MQISEKSLIDNSVTEFEYVEYLPRDSNNMNKDGQQTIETKDIDVFLLPHKAFLEIRGKLQTNANTDYNNNMGVGSEGQGGRGSPAFSYMVEI